MRVALLLAASLLCAAPLHAAQDPVKVSARLTDPRITTGGTTTLQISIETHGATVDEIGIPTLSDGLEVVSTSDFTQAQLRMPGGTSIIRRKDLVILASAPGAYRINSAVIRVGSTYYRTSPLDLIVSGAARSPASSSDGGSTLTVALQPDTVFIGQQVLLLAEVTFAEEARARQSRPPTFDPPAPSGFWIQDVPDPISVRLRVSEGRSVETQTYRRVYFPLTAGKFSFPPARLQYDVRRGFLYPPESRELRSDSARLYVLPLPESGRPSSFNGAVGNLTMSATLAQERVRAGEPAVLTVQVQGTGNVKALPQPRLPGIVDADIFSPTQESSVEIIDDRVGGIKKFRWLIVPKKAGVLIIPPIEYSVFDPERRAYVVLRTDSLRINASAVVVDAASDTSLRPLRAAPTISPLRWVQTPVFAAAQALPLVFVAGAAAWRRRRRRAPAAIDQTRHSRAQLADVHAGSDFLNAVQRVVCDAVAAVTGVQSSDPVSALRERGRNDAASELAALLGELRRLRYAPAEPYDTAALRARADAFIASLSPRRGRSAGAASLGACFLLLAFGAHAQNARNAPVDAFRNAVTAYQHHEFAAAANGFASYARAHPKDPDGWYDFGLASYRAGDPGRAVWAWLRAAKYAPRDADLRHNLEVAGAHPALTHVLPLDRLTTAERLLTAAAGWWLLAAGIAVIMGGHRRRGRLLGFAGAALIAVCAVTAAAAATTPPIVTPFGHGANLYASPSTRDDSLGTLAVGTVARVMSGGTEWLRVRATDGTEAWVERAAVGTP